MNYVDIDLKCALCGTEFVFTAGEQRFFRSKGFAYNRPKTCGSCRAKIKKRVRSDIGVTCADCGIETTVPFAPRQKRPVYCHACFTKRKVAT